MRIPAIEALFPVPWTVAARRMLPSASPQLTATALWGPVLGWCALELLAESVDAENPERVALDLYDRLRLREPFAQAFAALGFEGEEAWRVAARIKVVLLTGAEVGKIGEAPAEVGTGVEEPALTEDEKVALSPALWFDPDVRWLTGVHAAEGHAYLLREPYEELLWWLLMPSLLRLAGETALDRAAVEKMSKTVEEALATAEAAGYRIDALLGPAMEPKAGESSASEAETEAPATDEPQIGADTPPKERIEPGEPEIEPPVDTPSDPIKSV
jgi:hypothetical protein